MTPQERYLPALVALVVGGGVGFIAGSSGPDISQIEGAMESRLSGFGETQAEAAAAQTEAIAAQSETMTRIDSQLGDLTARLGAMEDSVASAAASTAGVAEKIGADIEGLGSRLGSAIETATSTQVEALETRIAGLRSPAESRAPAAAAPAAGGAAPAEPAAPQIALSGLPTADPIGPGETAMLSDGAVRVFLSRIDSDAGAARLSVNGETVTLAVGQSMSVEPNGDYCRVSLDGIDGNRVALAGACGDALPAPVGVAAGNVAILGDGAARVFVSGVVAGRARIAVNGIETQSVGVGESVSITDSCAVTVDGVDRGHVALGYGCS